MKKVTFLLIVVTIIAFGVNSCQKDKDGDKDKDKDGDGVYNPKHKISRVYAEGKAYGNIIFPKQIFQTWTWKKNKLESIALQNGTYTYTYDGNRISRISAGVNTMDFYYDGANLTKIEIQNITQTILIAVLERDVNKRITKVRYEFPENVAKSFEEYKTNYFEIKNMITFGVSIQMADILGINLEKQYKNYQAKGTTSIDFTFTYTGDNATKITLSGNGLSSSYRYTFDDKPNPYYQFDHFKYSDQFGANPSAIGFSKNNILSYYEESNPQLVYKNTYTYDGEKIDTWRFTEEYLSTAVEWTQYYTYE